jgi:hypothetical protein
VSDENDLVHPGRLVRVDLAGGVVDGTAPAAVFPQAVLLVP